MMNHYLGRTHSLLYLIGVLLTLQCIAPVSAGLEGPVVDAITYYNQAVDAAANGSYEESLILINKSLEIKPDFYLAQVTKASILTHIGDYPQAEELLQMAEKTHPDNGYILAAKASLFIETGRYKDALNAAEQALEHDPTLVQAWVLKGTAHGALGEFENEINASEKALSLDPTDAGALSNYQFAMAALTQYQNKTDRGVPEKTPLSLPIVLGAGLFAVGLWRMKKK